MRKILRANVIVAVFLLASCNAADPSPVLNEDVLVNLLTELHLADSRMLLDPSAPDSLRAHILDRYDVETHELEATLAYLSKHPDQLAGIYGRIVDKVVSSSEEGEESD